jgi:hypothetical protein
MDLRQSFGVTPTTTPALMLRIERLTASGGLEGTSAHETGRYNTTTLRNH